MTPFHIRPAGPSDACPLTALARQTFCETFTHYAPQALAAFLDEHYAEPVSLAALARLVHLAPVYFHRCFRQSFGLTPFGYMLGRRMDEARRLLADASLSIKEIAARVGYADPLYFSRVFRRQVHLTPSAYRRRHSGM